jgi:hypothetical protein
MPAPAPDEAPADRPAADAAWRQACDAWFMKPHGDLTAPTADGAAVIGRIEEDGAAAVPAAGMALALTLGGCGRVTAEETEIRRRRWKVR